jgi:large subunit ribosomal protein L1
MAKLTKKQKEAAAKIEKETLLSKDAAALIKTVASEFDESVDIAVRLV